MRFKDKANGPQDLSTKKVHSLYLLNPPPSSPTIRLLQSAALEASRFQCLKTNNV